MSRLPWLVLVLPAVAEAAPCPIVVTEAPDDVRAAISTWTRDEARCDELEVRAVTTADGIALTARTRDGRIYARVVPDATSAGVLIASWAAKADPDGVTVTVRLQRAEAVPVDVPPVPARLRSTRWIGISAVGHRGGREDDHARIGIRGEFDLASSGRWTAGIAAAVSNRLTEYFDTSGMKLAELDNTELRAIGYVAATFGGGPLKLRLAVGAGGVVRYEHGFADEGYGPIASMPMSRTISGLVADGSAQAVIEVSPRWAITAGVYALVSPHDLRDEGTHEVEALGALGVRRGL